MSARYLAAYLPPSNPPYEAGTVEFAGTSSMVVSRTHAFVYSYDALVKGRNAIGAPSLENALGPQARRVDAGRVMTAELACTEVSGAGDSNRPTILLSAYEVSGGLMTGNVWHVGLITYDDLVRVVVGSSNYTTHTGDTAGLPIPGADITKWRVSLEVDGTVGKVRALWQDVDTPDTVKSALLDTPVFTPGRSVFFAVHVVEPRNRETSGYISGRLYPFALDMIMDHTVGATDCAGGVI